MAGIKKPACGRFFVQRRCCLQRFDPRIQTALMSGCLVLVDQALICRAVDNRNRIFVCFGGTLFISSFDSLFHVFQVGAHSAAARRVVLTVRFSLTSALAGLYCVGQGLSPDKVNARKSAVFWSVQGFLSIIFFPSIHSV